MKLLERITLEPGKRGGKLCVRGMRITVYDVPGWLASGMSEAEILADFPELEPEDIRACLHFAVAREHGARLIRVAERQSAAAEGSGDPPGATRDAECLFG